LMNFYHTVWWHIQEDNNAGKLLQIFSSLRRLLKLPLSLRFPDHNLGCVSIRPPSLFTPHIPLISPYSPHKHLLFGFFSGVGFL
jgi:hypothetical protein